MHSNSYLANVLKNPASVARELNRLYSRLRHPQYYSDVVDIFDEVRSYGHPENPHIEPLFKVASHAFSRGSRKEVVPEPPEDDGVDEYLIEKHLESLC